MSTLLDLDGRGELFKFDPQLGWRDQEERLLYLRPKVAEWINANVPDAEAEYDVELSPAEELDLFLSNYASGEPLEYERQIRALVHLGDGIWELKTLHFRMFGWFTARDCFVVAEVDFATRIKKHRLYPGYAGSAARFRDQLNLDEPKYVVGDDPNAVLSNFRYPSPQGGG